MRSHSWSEGPPKNMNKVKRQFNYLSLENDTGVDVNFMSQNLNDINKFIEYSTFNKKNVTTMIKKRKQLFTLRSSCSFIVNIESEERVSTLKLTKLYLI